MIFQTHHSSGDICFIPVPPHTIIKHSPLSSSRTRPVDSDEMACPSCLVQYLGIHQTPRLTCPDPLTSLTIAPWFYILFQLLACRPEDWKGKRSINRGKIKIFINPVALSHWSSSQIKPLFSSTEFSLTKEANSRHSLDKVKNENNSAEIIMISYDKANFNWESKIIRGCGFLLYFALWLVQKTRAILWTGQMWILNQSRLGRPRFPALSAV